MATAEQEHQAKDIKDAIARGRLTFNRLVEYKEDAANGQPFG
jgi:hypothetical protein